ncbi:MAG: SUMF1/EgtB/PvdO family nonheme iron enzyme [Myxococcales bacterium]|nr:SUMF1/EgtB/PvdO family nonheme iron enzyme [Myxococcales bacterium]
MTRDHGSPTGQAMRDPLGLVGTTIDRRYEVRRIVAEGGFGLVYEAEAVALGVPVAIKVLRAELLESSPEARARFGQEAKLLVRMRHPAIVQLSDAAHLDDGTPYLVLEWIEGETLDAFLARVGPLPLEDTLGLLGPVASAISYAHGEGVIHRDLKPSNVMVGRDRAVKVLDFGVARWSHDSGVKTTTLKSTGLSVGFAAPEQYARDFGVVDHRADQFALAAIVFSALTGEAPFAGESLREVMFATCMATERPSVRKHRDDLSSAVDNVVKRGLAIRPEARYPDVRAFFSALVQASQGHVEPQEEAATTRPNDAPAASPATMARPLSPATLPSPQLPPAPRTEKAAASLPFAPTQRNHEGAMTEKTGAGPRRPPPPPPESAPASSVAAGSGATKWIAFLALGGIVGGAAFLVQPLFSPRPLSSAKPLASHSTSISTVPTTSASPSTSASAEKTPCGELQPHEACILGGKLRRGPPDCNVDDPAHKAACPGETLTVKTFVLDREEVSGKRWDACVAIGKCRKVDVSPTLPVTSVTAKEAEAFCAFEKARLPTDAEWELAAAGLAGRAFPWGNAKPGAANAVFTDDPSKAPAGPVATDAAPTGENPEGVVHLAGNVAEWTSTPAPKTAPWPEIMDDDDQPRRWVRGGSFRHDWDALRAWAREAWPESRRDPRIGFRCAKAPRKT